MMMTILKRTSPFVLGVALISAQVIQLPIAQAASLGLGGSSDPILLEPAVPSDANSIEKVPASESGTPATEVTASAGACTTLKATASQTASAPTEPTRSKSSGLSYQSDKLASAALPGPTDLGSDPQPASSVAESSDPQLVAQLSPDGDCCEVGGNTTCELAGAPPAVGGGAVAGAPLALLGAIPLAAAVPLALGGGDSNVPEPSETAGIVAGFGLLGLWASRRLSSSQAKGSDRTKK